jgi:hypothetical protein
MIISAFIILIFLKQKICFEEIKTSSKFGEKNLGFVKTRFMKPSDEQITYGEEINPSFKSSGFVRRPQKLMKFRP